MFLHLSKIQFSICLSLNQTQVNDRKSAVVTEPSHSISKTIKLFVLPE